MKRKSDNQILGQIVGGVIGAVIIGIAAIALWLSLASSSPSVQTVDADPTPRQSQPDPQTEPQIATDSEQMEPPSTTPPTRPASTRGNQGTEKLIPIDAIGGIEWDEALGADELINGYSSEYKGKTLLVTGTVSETGENMYGTPFVTLKDGDDIGNTWKRVKCYGRSFIGVEIEDIEKGERIRVVGRCRGRGNQQRVISLVESTFIK